MSLVPLSNDAPDLSACHREPIHQPGSIQPHGVLIVADALTQRVTHVSANFARSTGMPSRSALDAPLAELLGPQALSQVQKALTSERYASTNIMTLDLAIAREPRRSVSAHSHDGHIFLELEAPSSAADHEHVVSRVQAILAQLRQAKSVASLCEQTAETLRALTGYDRVMVYRFDPDGHGEVIAENKRADLASFLHLRYPASDIPSQARQLYLKNRIRVIVDVGYEPVAMLGTADATAPPLDMSYCGLRSVSPTHLEYLHNMGVGATLAISLIQDDKLWGMIVCHHLTAHPVPSDLRSSCDLIGQLVMLLIGRVGEAEELAQVIRRGHLMASFKQAIEQSASVLEGLAPMSVTLRDVVSATGVALRLNGKLHLFGVTPDASQAQVLLDDLIAVANHRCSPSMPSAHDFLSTPGRATSPAAPSSCRSSTMSATRSSGSGPSFRKPSCGAETRARPSTSTARAGGSCRASRLPPGANSCEARRRPGPRATGARLRISDGSSPRACCITPKPT
ncbi:hypothetical protein OCOJLMKI_0677 [Methylobacterium iners]|uniref:Phytochrome chromophore attachment site domain-containing protein n=1 Tax=Methylobacterium iners TaxID=418707 RepID=A0ABQ4RU26_9HYPH|nr:GAF domain-containing protein [Methylobacterium iners]GJD93482.1 hypothetical protein OCOJLMKI_0677 [Methylobacterium iners]